jgi:hypothetical protein
MRYFLTTFCYGKKYEPILSKWTERIKEKCSNCEIKVFNDINVLSNTLFTQNYPGYIWAIRLKHNLDLLLKTSIPVVMCDLDVIIEKDIQPIVNLEFDIIISKEIGESNAYPKDCSEKLGFGVCCGFMILKQTAKEFMLNVFKNMSFKTYNTYDDQVNLMNYIVNNNYTVSDEEIILDGIKYTNKIIQINNIKICVLDFNIIVRDPIFINGQFANHINIDNVGGTSNFLKYYDNKLENLPLTCRCGKIHLGDNNICKHIELRKKN